MISGARLGLTRAFRAQSDLLENALSLGGSTVVTAVLGAVYWWVAARFLDPISVGYGSAATSAATLLATVGIAGYGSLLLGHVANSGTSTGSLIATGLGIATVASLVIGAAYGLFVDHFVQSFAPYCASVAGIALFAVTTALTGLTTVLDDALVGLFLGPVQLKRNTVFAAAKVVALVVLALMLPDRSGGDVLASWSLGLALSLIAVSTLLTRQGKRIWHSPRLIALRRSARTAMMHHWINLSTVAPRLLVPLVVTGVISATANGWLYPAWIVATLAYVVPQHLATSLFAVGAANRSVFAEKTRTSIKIALGAGVPGTLVIALLAHPLLLVFGSEYAQHATVPMRWLMLGYVPNVVRFHYVTVLRVEHRLVRAATVMTVLGALEVAAILVGAHIGGLSGVAAALAAAMWVEGFATALPVLRTMEATPLGYLRRRSSMPVEELVADNEDLVKYSLVSVVIPTTGRASVSDAVESVLAQSHPSVEVLVVYDGDGVLPVKLPRDSRVTAIATAGKAGVSAARALGIGSATGEFVAFLDDDDTWERRKLEVQLGMLESHDASRPAAVCASRIRLVDERGHGQTVVPTRVIRTDEMVADYLFVRRRVRWGEAVIHPSTILCDRRLAAAVPWPRLSIHEDWDWLLRLVAEHDARILMADEALVRVTETKDSASRSAKWRESLAWVTNTPSLTNRQKADLLLCTTAAYARAAGNRRAVMRIARRSLAIGPPGPAALTFFCAFQLFPPEALTRLARALPTSLRPAALVAGPPDD